MIRRALLCVMLCHSLATEALATFALQSGDRVLILGDENVSHVRGAKGQSLVENLAAYTVMRFPTWKVEFMSIGTPGGTAEKLLESISVIDHVEPTVLLVIVGIHDILPGGASLPTPLEFATRKTAHVTAIAQIADAAVARGIRAYFCSYPVTSTNISSVYGTTALHDYLAELGLATRTTADAHGAIGIDLTTWTRAVGIVLRQNDPMGQDNNFSDPTDPGFVLNKVGHLVASYPLLVQLNAPSETSSVSLAISGSSAQVSEASGAAVSGLTWSPTDKRLKFTRVDGGLPFPVPFFTDLSYAFTGNPAKVSLAGFEDDINRYMLRVTGLPGPSVRYRVIAEGRHIASSFSASQLAEGINLAHRRRGYVLIPEVGGPWDAQGLKVVDLVRLGLVEQEMMRLFFDWIPLREPAVSGKVPRPNVYHSGRKAILALNRFLSEVARPQPYEFVIEPTPTPKPTPTPTPGP